MEEQVFDLINRKKIAIVTDFHFDEIKGCLITEMKEDLEFLEDKDLVFFYLSEDIEDVKLNNPLKVMLSSEEFENLNKLCDVWIRTEENPYYGLKIMIECITTPTLFGLDFGEFIDNLRPAVLRTYTGDKKTIFKVLKEHELCAFALKGDISLEDIRTFVYDAPCGVIYNSCEKITLAVLIEAELWDYKLIKKIIKSNILNKREACNLVTMFAEFASQPRYKKRRDVDKMINNLCDMIDVE